MLNTYWDIYFKHTNFINVQNNFYIVRFLLLVSVATDENIQWVKGIIVQQDIWLRRAMQSKSNAKMHL